MNYLYMSFLKKNFVLALIFTFLSGVLLTFIAFQLFSFGNRKDNMSYNTQSSSSSSSNSSSNDEDWKLITSTASNSESSVSNSSSKNYSSNVSSGQNVSKTYTNTNYPKFSFTYNSDWVLEERWNSDILKGGSIILRKNLASLQFDLSGLAKIRSDGPSQCFDENSLQYKAGFNKVGESYVRFPYAGYIDQSEMTGFRYIPKANLVFKGEANFETSLAEIKKSDITDLNKLPKNPLVCTNPFTGGDFFIVKNNTKEELTTCPELRAVCVKNYNDIEEELTIHLGNIHVASPQEIQEAEEIVKSLRF